uniref:ornithine carbamoyltransferase n=1 Tax=Helicotheca tamesis TaxID=374047 RepID=A0A7S2MG95_9STRA|mmetsp:Transcript_15594/g.21310  ORF Transcript_15594/g.21310 Transcript_15594/m.21310 type:complete len:358 (+) Transcript_15594:156-1229(+)|eukprot:CAMPEP_0185724686 /NCGR_PEP_ID=MMETSP1171-20130828/1095_1 /TAXON_ID=374046 /ORGANISM="Helicotheca tamensis, Strain CCMP826" /LENGTH=357 /DNA_ID=CAMNT_0028392597 /DNA_START=155 /DNA_END=1228 /DNA_ORIENTATION=+
MMSSSIFTGAASASRYVVKSRAAALGFAASKAYLSTSSDLAGMAGRNFMSIDELSNKELRGLLDLSKQYKATYGKNATIPPTSAPKPLTGKSVSMIFQKRSTRTRVSTETGMSLLGGHALFLGPSDIQLGVNESMRDTANVLSRFNSIILARVYGHDDIVELGKHATVPVINALSDLHHPLQTLADLMALEDHFGGDLRGKTLAWVGDGNNVLHDLMMGAAKLGMNVNVATPAGYEANERIVNITKQLAGENGGKVFLTAVAEEAVKGSDVIVTDTWVSMGQEDEYAKRIAEFAGYEVNSTLMSKANDGAVFLHCLPRHPEEVTDEVFYSDQSLVFPEAENRMWTVMAVMAAQLGKV